LEFACELREGADPYGHLQGTLKRITTTAANVNAFTLRAGVPTGMEMERNRRHRCDRTHDDPFGAAAETR
jgi:hypothetical protein